MNDVPGVMPLPAAAALVPDAHGQAALLLTESLLHGLVARSVITVAEAIEIVDIASEVKTEIADQGVEPAAVAEHSRALLDAIGHSLRVDLPG